MIFWPRKKTTKQPVALDEPVARSTSTRPCSTWFVVGCVRFVGLICSFIPGGRPPLTPYPANNLPGEILGISIKAWD